ncbi:MAG: HD domain-containing protein [Deltaproteobacteria bacterium]|nr:HD domain-containing protein [Deltaproteobacteria bacterium]
MDDSTKTQPGYGEIDQLKRYANDLAEVYKSEKERRRELEVVNKELQAAYFDTIYRLSLAAEFRDEDTGDHIMRMGRSCRLIAQKLGLPPEQVKNIEHAAPMHDVGKIGIPDSILLKPGKLTEEEFEIMKTHTIIGAKLLGNSKSEILRVGEEISLYHHERWDGKGYPHGLSGEDIPIVGRIVCVMDVFDAPTSRRPYKDPYPMEVALDIIKQESGKQFDPVLVDILLDNSDEITQIKGEVEAMKKSDGIPLEGFKWSDRDIIEGRNKSFNKRYVKP